MPSKSKLRRMRAQRVAERHYAERANGLNQKEEARGCQYFDISDGSEAAVDESSSATSNFMSMFPFPAVNVYKTLHTVFAMTLVVFFGYDIALSIAKDEGLAWVMQILLTFGLAITVLAYIAGHYSGAQMEEDSDPEGDGSVSEDDSQSEAPLSEEDDGFSEDDLSGSGYDPEAEEGEDEYWNEYEGEGFAGETDTTTEDEDESPPRAVTGWHCGPPPGNTSYATEVDLGRREMPTHTKNMAFNMSKDKKTSQDEVNKKATTDKKSQREGDMSTHSKRMVLNPPKEMKRSQDETNKKATTDKKAQREEHNTSDRDIDVVLVAHADFDVVANRSSNSSHLMTLD